MSDRSGRACSTAGSGGPDCPALEDHQCADRVITSPLPAAILQAITCLSVLLTMLLAGFSAWDALLAGWIGGSFLTIALLFVLVWLIERNTVRTSARWTAAPLRGLL
jgi:hypothetical protein